jgi:hypothetical protein
MSGEVKHIAVRWLAPSELLDPELRTSEAAAFVGDSWQKSSKRPIEELRELVRRQPCVIGIATPIGEPNVFLGWAVAVPVLNALVHVYVKALYRAPKEGGESEFRVGSSLAILCGIDFAKPVPCYTWSRAAARIAAKPGNPYNLVRALNDASEWAATWQ